MKIILALFLLLFAIRESFGAEIENSRAMELLDTSFLGELQSSRRDPVNQVEPIIHVSAGADSGLTLLMKVAVSNSGLVTIQGAAQRITLKGSTPSERDHTHWVLIDLVDDLAVSFPQSAKDASVDLEITAVFAR